MQKIYLYRLNKHVLYAVIASNRSIAQWYKNNSTPLRHTKFVGMGIGNEHAIGCAADKALQDTIDCLLANGGTIPSTWPKLPKKGNNDHE